VNPGFSLMGAAMKVRFILWIANFLAVPVKVRDTYLGAEIGSGPQRLSLIHLLPLSSNPNHAAASPDTSMTSN